MATYSANFPELMETRQKAIFFNNFVMRPTLWTDLFQRVKSTKSHEDRMRVAGLTTFKRKNEGGPVSFTDPVQGTRVRQVHETFALGCRSTWESIRDDQWNIIDKMPADLGDSGRDHQERLAWNLINDAYASGGVFTGLEGEILFSATHTLLRTGGTQSNVLTPPAALSETSLQNALTQAQNMLTEEGRFTMVDWNKLLYNPALQHTAYVLLDTEYKPGSADNDKSTVISSRSGITPLVDKGVPYITSTVAWSLHAAKGMNGLKWYDREEMFFERAKDNLTFDQLHWAAYRASVAFDEYKNNFASLMT